MSSNPDRRDVLLRALIAAVPTWVLLGAHAGGEEAPAGAVRDFDFLFGSWSVRHRYRKQWLASNDEWAEFDGTCATQPLMGGAVNVDDHMLMRPAGPSRAVALRAFDPNAGTWSIWWLDARTPHSLGVPVVGGFGDDGVGHFSSDDMLGDRPVKVRFQWRRITPDSCRWEQSFSPDSGATWETNWVMQFSKA